MKTQVMLLGTGIGILLGWMISFIVGTPYTVNEIVFYFIAASFLNIVIDVYIQSSKRKL